MGIDKLEEKWKKILAFKGNHSRSFRIIFGLVPCVCDYVCTWTVARFSYGEITGFTFLCNA